MKRPRVLYAYRAIDLVGRFGNFGCKPRMENLSNFVRKWQNFKSCNMGAKGGRHMQRENHADLFA